MPTVTSQHQNHGLVQTNNQKQTNKQKLPKVILNNVNYLIPDKNQSFNYKIINFHENSRIRNQFKYKIEPFNSGNLYNNVYGSWLIESSVYITLKLPYCAILKCRFLGNDSRRSQLILPPPCLEDCYTLPVVERFFFRFQ